MKVLVSLLNWRTADMTLRALDALMKEVRAMPGGVRVIVVDNDSQDGSEDKLRAAVKERGYADVVEVVQSGKNGGYGFGNNVALRLGLAMADQPDYLYLLNSDAFVDEGALRALVKAADDDPGIGICGSYSRDLDGNPHATCFRFPTVWSELDRSMHFAPLSRLLAGKRVPMPVPTEDTDVPWVSGASMLIRRTVLEQIGLFDETFFLYYEETDLCLRTRRAGWRIRYVCASTVTHIGSATTGMGNLKKPMPEYMFFSRRHYLLKNHGRAMLWLANAAYLVGGATFRLRRRLQGKPDPERPNEWRDWTFYNLRHP